MKVGRLLALSSSIAGGLLLAPPVGAQSIEGVPCKIVDGAPEGDTRLISGILDVRECWQADPTDGSQHYLNDLYTRWIVEEVGSRPFARDYKSERRSALERLFLGKTRNTTIAVKIRVRDPDVDFTLPLVIADYSGKRGEGQAFTTVLSRSDMSLPDFRISPTTSANIEATARSSTEIDVRAAGIVLGTLRDTLAIAAPGSSLLTSVNREQVQRAATAYDTALSRLLSSTVAETITSGRMLSEWQDKGAIYVSVTVPRSIRTVGDRTDPALPPEARRLTFRIRMTCPRISIFDTLNVCEVTDGSKPALISSSYPSDREGAASDSAAGWPGWDSQRYRLAIAKLRGRLSAHQVLSFKLAQGKSLRQFLTEQEWFISLSKAVVTVPEAVNVRAAKEAAKRTTETIADSSGTTTESPEPPTSTNGPASGEPDLEASTKSANELCEAITEKLYSVGLSHLDANIGLWATVTGMADFSNARGVFQNAPSCREHMPTGPATGAWRFEEAPAAEAPRALSPNKKPQRRRRR